MKQRRRKEKQYQIIKHMKALEACLDPSVTVVLFVLDCSL